MPTRFKYFYYEDRERKFFKSCKNINAKVSRVCWNVFPSQISDCVIAAVANISMCEPSQRAENYHLDCSKKNFFFLRSCSITPKSKEISIGKHRHRQRVTWDAKIDLRGNPWTVSLLYDPSFYCLFLRAMSTSNLVMCRAKHYWWRSWHVITETSSRACVCACARARILLYL